MKSNRAFTLIELLIVIAIIAILALIAIPNFIEAQTRAKVARCHADMRSMANAIEAYFVDHNTYPLAAMDPGQDHASNQFAYISYLPPDLGLDGRGTTGLTTPVAYMTTIPIDTFQLAELNWQNRGFFYYNFLGAARHVVLWPNEWVARNVWDLAQVAELVAPAPMRFNVGPDSAWNVPNPYWEAAPVHHANWALLSYGPDQRFTVDVDNTGARRMCVHCFLNGYGHWQHMRNGLATVYDPTNGTISRGFIWRLSSKGMK